LAGAATVHARRCRPCELKSLLRNFRARAGRELYGRHSGSEARPGLQIE